MSGFKRILVTGATGKQGGALIKALTSTSSPSFELVALTRNAHSPSAQKLSKVPNVTILQGDMDDVASIFQKIGNQLHGVFSVQTPLKPKREEAQGKALVDAAARIGVKHFIYTSADRGGPGKSDRDPTPVPHFISKFNIEQHLKAVAAKTPEMQWTIIRPVAFMENLTPDFFGKVFGTAWRHNKREMQLVSTDSIGIMAAEAFKNPDQFTSRSVSLATDSLTYEQANAVFKRKIGTEMPTTWDLLFKFIMILAWDQLGIMFKWIREQGPQADPKEFISKYPGMLTFEQWLEQSSKFK